MNAPAPPHPAPPLVILGLDAFEVEWLERWMAEGRLPFLASLLGRSTFARVRSEAFSDAPWPSMFSGSPPGHHGFFAHLQMAPGTYRIVRTDGRSCRRPPFWHRFGGAGPRVALLDVPKTYPVENLDGAQVCGWGEHYPLLARPESRPAPLAGELVARFGAYPHVDEITRPASRAWERRALRAFLANVDRKAAATRHLLAAGPWDLFFSVFAEVHYAEHQFLHLLDPSHWAFEPDAPADLREALPAVASRTDAALAHISEGLPHEVNLIVLSVHGIEPNYSANLVVEDILRAMGLLAPPAAPVPPAGRLESLLRRTHDVRALIPARVRQFINRHLVSTATHDRAMADAFASSADWTRTQAFLLPSDHFQAFISLNLKGREPVGIVEPGAAAYSVFERIRQEFLRLINDETGRPAVSAVEWTRERYPGPEAAHLPDIVVDWARGTPIRRLLHPDLGVFEMPAADLRKAQHTRRGFLMASGPAFAAGVHAGEIETIDIAPTLLHLMGQAADPGMEGRARLDLLASHAGHAASTEVLSST